MDSMVTGSLPPGCPIRISAGQWVFAPRRSFSQLVTSFFASESLGIPHAPFSFRYFFITEPKSSIMFRLWFARYETLCLLNSVFLLVLADVRCLRIAHLASSLVIVLFCE